MTVATFDQLSLSQDHKVRHFPSLAPTTPPTRPKEPGSTPRYDNVSAALSDVAAAPVCSPSAWAAATQPSFPVEEVKVMQQSQRDAWRHLACRFKVAHRPVARTSSRQTKATAIEPGRTRTVSYGKYIGDHPHRERGIRLPRQVSLPAQRQRTLSSNKLRSPAVDDVRRSLPVSGGTGGIRSLISRQLRRIA